MTHADHGIPAADNGASDERYLSVQDLAARYDVSRATVYNWNKRGTGPAYLKPGGNLVRYRIADVLAWEKSRERERAA